jgi:hypothetical protein
MLPYDKELLPAGKEIAVGSRELATSTGAIVDRLINRYLSRKRE